MISTTVVWIGEQGWLEALMVSEGFTGMIIDTLDRRRWYEDGRQVARARLKDVASTEAAGQAYVRKLVAEPDILERARKDYGAGEGRTVMTAMSALNESQLADIAGKLGVSISGSRAAMLSSVRQSLLPQTKAPPLMPLRIGMTPERARTSDTSEESEEKARISAGAVLTPEAVLAELRTPQLKGQHELALLTANAGKALGVDAFDSGKFEAEQVRLLARTRAVFADPKNFDYDAMMELIDTPNAFAAAKTTDPEEVSKKIAAITGDNGDQPGFKVTHAWWEDDGFKKRMGEARGIVSRLYPGLKDLSVVMGSHPTEYSSITPTRIVTDSAQGNGPKWGGHIGTIVTMNADNAMTVRSMVHELMHAVEVHRPELLARSIAFRNERNSVNPRPPGYLAGTINSQEADVLTWSDEFAKGIPPIRAGYIGKNYGLIATEVQSVGMEQIISGGAAGLFQRDPEYAAFLLSQMRTPAAARWVGNSHHTEPFYEQLDEATRTKYASVFCRQEDIAAFMKLHGERDAEAKRQYEVGRDAKARMREQEAKKALKESVVFIGGNERLREFFVREGFSGIIVDSLNRKQHYRDGVQVKGDGSGDDDESGTDDRKNPVSLRQPATGGTPAVRLHPSIDVTSKPKPRKLLLKVDPGTARAIDAVREMIPGITDQQIAAIANNPEGVELQAEVESGEPGRNRTIKKGIWLASFGGGVKSQRRIYKNEDGNLVIKNEFFSVSDDGVNAGRGLSLFVDQVRAAKEIGVSRLDTLGATNPGKMNGAYTWPLFGYDGPISDRVLREMPDEIRKQLGDNRNIQSLIRFPSGRKWWQTEAKTMELSFDLTDDSDSMNQMKLYAAERGLKPPYSEPIRWTTRMKKKVLNSLKKLLVPG